MRILMTRTNPDRHRFEIIRADGTREYVELETRSLLVHDLVHFAVESEVPFRHGFYGLLSQGKSLAELSDTKQPWPVGTDIAASEGLVGPLQSMLKGGDFDASLAHEKFALFSKEPPSVELLTRIGAQFRAVFGRYHALRFGETLELEWPETQTETPVRKHTTGQTEKQTGPSRGKRSSTR